MAGRRADRAGGGFVFRCPGNGEGEGCTWPGPPRVATWHRDLEKDYFGCNAHDGGPAPARCLPGC